MRASADVPTRILGIDPGSRHTGYGLVEKAGSNVSYLESGRISPPPRYDLTRRLQFLYEAAQQLVDRFQPNSVAVEDIFHSVNAQALIKLAHARGVLILAAAQQGLEVTAYTPATVKKSVVGTGAATKEQVAWMVQRLLPGSPDGAPLDTTDALAVALCHAAHLTAPVPPRTPGGSRKAGRRSAGTSPGAGEGRV